MAEAEAALRKVLEAQRRVLGDDSRDTLRTRHELARAAPEQVLGDDHPDTHRTLDVLADAERRRPLKA